MPQRKLLHHGHGASELRHGQGGQPLREEEAASDGHSSTEMPLRDESTSAHRQSIRSAHFSALVVLHPPSSRSAERFAGRLLSANATTCPQRGSPINASGGRLSLSKAGSNDHKADRTCACSLHVTARSSVPTEVLAAVKARSTRSGTLASHMALKLSRSISSPASSALNSSCKVEETNFPKARAARSALQYPCAANNASDAAAGAVSSPCRAAKHTCQGPCERAGGAAAASAASSWRATRGEPQSSRAGSTSAAPHPSFGPSARSAARKAMAASSRARSQGAEAPSPPGVEVAAVRRSPDTLAPSAPLEGCLVSGSLADEAARGDKHMATAKAGGGKRFPRHPPTPPRFLESSPAQSCGEKR